MNQTSAEISAQAVQAVLAFIRRATGADQLSEVDAKNALFLVLKECEQMRAAFSASAWHREQPVHAFEALSCKWQGTNPRWPVLTLNLHYTVRPDGTPFIATPEELPLKSKYFVSRVIADASFSAPDGD